MHFTISNSLSCNIIISTIKLGLWLNHKKCAFKILNCKLGMIQNSPWNKVPFSLDHLYFGSNLDPFFPNIDQTTHTYFIIVQPHGITLSLFHPFTRMYMLSLSLSLGSFSLFLHVNLFQQPNLLLSFILLFFVFFTTATPLL